MSPTPVNFIACSRNFIWADVCECLERKPCWHAYTYGGDVFCKHPLASQKSGEGANEQMVFEYAHAESEKSRQDGEVLTFQLSSGHN